MLGYWEWLEGLERGVAAHHAGLLPAFKEVVEELFQRKLVKVVFATETLALGINMPARTVVLEKLEKFNGEARVPITPGEYTQLTGRAGTPRHRRRGPLRHPLGRGPGPAGRRLARLPAHLPAELELQADLQHGREPHRAVRPRAHPRDPRVVVRAVPGGPRRRRPRAQGAPAGGVARRLREGRCRTTPGRAATSPSTPRSGARSATSRSARVQPRCHSASSGRSRQRQLADLRRRMRSHPAHTSPRREELSRWAERWWRLQAADRQLQRQIATRTGAIARVFDRVTEVLLERATSRRTTTAGDADRQRHRCSRGSTASATCCSPRASAAACGSGSMPAASPRSRPSLVFEARREEGVANDRYLPKGPFRRRLEPARGTLGAPRRPGARHTACPARTRRPSASARRCTRWARGGRLDDVLRDADLQAGDFVRWTKQMIDLLDQIIRSWRTASRPAPRSRRSRPSGEGSSPTRA